MKRSGILIVILFMLGVWATPFVSLASVEKLYDEGIIEEIEGIEEIFDEGLPLKIERKVLKHFGCPAERLASILDLDEKTEKEIEEMELEQREKMIDTRSKIEKLNIEIERILMEDRLDTRKLLSRYKEIAKLKEEIEIKKIEHKVNIYDLIPDEKKKDAKKILFYRQSHILKLRNVGDWNEFREGMHKFRGGMQEFRKEMEKMQEDCKGCWKL